MKKEKRNSFRKRKNALKAHVVLKEARREQKKIERQGVARKSIYPEGYSRKLEKIINHYLRCETERSFYVPYDGDYYYERNPSRLFHRLIPVLHKYHVAREWLNDYDELHKKHQEAYVCEICRRGVTQEIEMALIHSKYFNEYGGPWEESCENLLIALHKHGHKFSPMARRMMKWRCSYAYSQIYPDDKA